MSATAALDPTELDAPVRRALGVIFRAVGDGAFLQIGGLGAKSRIYGFLEAPEAPGSELAGRNVDASGDTIVETLIKLAEGWEAK